MNRADFQELSRMREVEAEALLQAGHFAGAYYLAGYAVECALKACIAKQTNEFDFPDRDAAIAAFTHDLDRLVKAAGLTADYAMATSASPQFVDNWQIVRQWKETARYEARIAEERTRELFRACTEQPHGVLTWVRRLW